MENNIYYYKIVLNKSLFFFIKPDHHKHFMNYNSSLESPKIFQDEWETNIIDVEEILPLNNIHKKFSYCYCCYFCILLFQ